MSTSFDVMESLTRDHRLLERLLAQLDDERQPIHLCILFARIISQLAAHELAEQQFVSAVSCSAIAAAERRQLERLGEHQEANELLAEMRKLLPDEPGFKKRASALRLDLQSHFEAEETSVFPRIRDCLGPDELLDLADQVVAARATLTPVGSQSQSG